MKQTPHLWLPANHADRRPILLARGRMKSAFRRFFEDDGFLEVECGQLQRSPGNETHLHALATQVMRPDGAIETLYLHTSPEFAAKKLLAAGETRIFDFARVFRNRERGALHATEFTMLEFYETNITLEQLQTRVEGLFLSLAQKTLEKFKQTPAVNLSTPWPRFTVNDLFLQHAGIDLRGSTAKQLSELCNQHHLPASENEPWDDLYFKIWLNLIEPKLPSDQPCFITHYPVSQSSLCNRVKDAQGFEWANRFELYVGKLELGNAFDELRDANIQRENFLKDQRIRKEIYGESYPASPIDEELLTAIELMPPTCGIAIGLDRLAMLLLNAHTIDEVIPLASYWPNS